jgi:hypothetical protein
MADPIETPADMFADQLLDMLSKRLKMSLTLHVSTPPTFSGVPVQSPQLHVMVMLHDTEKPERAVFMDSKVVDLPTPKLVY